MILDDLRSSADVVHAATIPSKDIQRVEKREAAAHVWSRADHGRYPDAQPYSPPEAGVPRSLARGRRSARSARELNGPSWGGESLGDGRWRRREGRSSLRRAPRLRSRRRFPLGKSYPHDTLPPPARPRPPQGPVQCRFRSLTRTSRSACRSTGRYRKDPGPRRHELALTTDPPTSP